MQSNPLREFLGEADWQRVVEWINSGEWLHKFEGLDIRLYEYYEDEMPYGTMKARDGDPEQWLFNKVTSSYADQIPELA